MADAPHRRLRLQLALEADSLDEMHDALSRIALDLLREGRESRRVTSGGRSSGHHLTLDCDPAMNGDTYRRLLKEYVAAKRQEREEGGDRG